MSMCTKCCGIKKIVIGGLLLLNAFVWPKWGIAWAGSGWIQWFAVIMVLLGLLKFVPNKCNSCKKICSSESEKGKKK